MNAGYNANEMNERGGAAQRQSVAGNTPTTEKRIAVGRISPFPDRAGYSVSRYERHGLVMIIQIMLDVLSIYYDSFGPLVVSGVYDMQTESAVRAFQKANGLGQSGRVDKRTWNRMAEEFNSAVKENQ